MEIRAYNKRLRVYIGYTTLLILRGGSAACRDVKCIKGNIVLFQE